MDSITITREQFRDAAAVANEMFLESGDNKSNDTVKNGLFMLHNILISALIEKALFDEEEDK